MKQNLSIRKAQDDVAAYLTAKGPAWSGLGKHYYLVTHLVEEIGELARAVINLEDKVIEPHRRGLAAPSVEKTAALLDSIGDSFFHLLKLCVAYGLDLEEAFESSFGAIKNKYPVDHSFRDGRR